LYLSAEIPQYNILSSSSLSKNIKIKIYRTVVIYVVFYECETWSVTSREEHRLSVFENMELRKIKEIGKYDITKSFMICTPKQTS
jgi:hypothetical protein